MAGDVKGRQRSSSSAGFFQAKPILENQLYEDLSLNRILKFYIPSELQHTIESDLSRFGERVLSNGILKLVADAERNPPSLRTWDTFGRRKDELITSEGWRGLQEIGITEGIVAIPYENKHGPYSRVHQFLKYHLWSASSAYVTCPSAMTDGTASLLKRSLSSKSLVAESRSVLQSAFQRLISRDANNAWTSGQWMTERVGGSDVSGTETVAVQASQPTSSNGIEGSSLGPYKISGFKWFSSATDANMCVLLAKSGDGKLSAFYAPMRRTIPGSSDTELNGVRIQRLKNKLGTKALPTAELQLNDMRGFLLGNLGQGVKEISTILNITRVHTAVTAVALWGRGLAISRAFARVRSIGTRRLLDIPAHTTTMAKQEVEYRGYMHLTFFTVLLLGISEQKSSLALSGSTPSNASLKRIMPSYSEAQILLRVLTPVIKALTAKASTAGLSECMESLGGVGYLENEDIELNIARLFRDASVLSIWEGTTDVLATDMLKVLKGRQGEEVCKTVRAWVRAAAPNAAPLKRRWEKLFSTVRSHDFACLTLDGRDLMKELGAIVVGCLLVVDAENGKDEVATEIMKRSVNISNNPEISAWEEQHAWNQKIAFGSKITPERPKL